MSEKVSVIIPCYNHGKYVDEAVQSCLMQTYSNIEIIIVNDGSTDEFTNALLHNYKKEKTKVITTPNQGLAMARNVGIDAATGDYILPLDADDKIAPTYIEKAVNILKQKENVGIVYCRAEFFGTQTGVWDLPEYKFPDILNRNCIFCTAMFRKSDWKDVGGYKKEMIYGWEDYEFWLSLIEKGRAVYMLPEILFFYRKHTVSMVMKLEEDVSKKNYLYNQIFFFHKKMYQKYKATLQNDIKNRFYLFCYGKMPFFYKEKTPTHKIYHIGKLKIKVKRRRKAG